MNLYTKQKQADKHRKQTYSYQRWKEEWGGINEEVGINIYTLQYIKQISNKVLLYSTGNYIHYPVINHMEKNILKKECIGLPWWRSGWESACRCRRHGFVPRSGKIPHAAERLGPWAMASEPAHPEPVLRNGRGHTSERTAYRKKKKKKKKNL